MMATLGRDADKTYRKCPPAERCACFVTPDLPPVQYDVRKEESPQDQRETAISGRMVVNASKLSVRLLELFALRLIKKKGT